MSSIIIWAIRNPVSVLMLTLGSICLGIYGLKHLEYSLLPDISNPKFVVVVQFPGGSPDQLERYVTIPIEEAISSIPGLVELYSKSRENLSIVTAQFHWRINYKFTLLQIREKLDAIRHQFPENTSRPVIMDYSPNSQSAMELIMWTTKPDLASLSEFGRDVLKPRLTQLVDVAEIQISGDVAPLLRVALRPKKLQQYRVSYAHIKKVIREYLPDQSLTVRMNDGYNSYPLTVNFGTQELTQLGEVPVQLDSHESIRLKHLANIDIRWEQQEALTFMDTTQVIGIRVFKESGGNAIKASKQVRRVTRQIEAEFPGFHFQVVRDQGENVSRATGGLINAVLWGAGTAFIILIFFLQNLRLAVTLFLVIPIAIVSTGTLLYLFGLSLNLMTLGGLVLGVGLIIDNGIIITESVGREIEHGVSPSAIHSGVNRVGGPVIAATFTTIAIFLPVIYVRGQVAALFKAQSIAITLTLVTSLLAVFTFLPSSFGIMFSPRKNRKGFTIGKSHDIPTLKRTRRSSNIMVLNFTRIIDVLIQVRNQFRTLINSLKRVVRLVHLGLEQRYMQSLQFILNHKIVSIGCMVLICVGGIIVLFHTPRHYWPERRGTHVGIQVEIPQLYTPSQIQTVTEKSIKSLMSVRGVSSVITNVVLPKGKGQNLSALINRKPGMYTVDFFVLLDRSVLKSAKIISQLVTVLQLPGGTINVRILDSIQENFDDFTQGAFQLFCTGHDQNLVSQAANALRDVISSVTAIEGIQVSNRHQQEGFIIAPSIKTLEKYRISDNDLATFLRVQSNGEKIGIWEHQTRIYPVILDIGEPRHSDFHNLSQTQIITQYSSLPLHQISDIFKDVKTSEIVRENKNRAISVSAFVPFSAYSRLSDFIKEWIRNNSIPGVSIKIAGESRRMSQSFKELRFAFYFAVLIVFLILAAQFESVVHPLNVLFTVPMGLAGGGIGLAIFGKSLNVISFIGLIMLIGIGVNDAIIKVDSMRKFSQINGISTRQVVLKSSQLKLRPVLMTTLTTIGAILPFFFISSENSQTTASLAAVVIGGISITTLLTLYFTPLLYESFQRTGSKKPGN